MFDFFASVGLVVEQDVAAASPDVGAYGGQCHGGGDELDESQFLFFLSVLETSCGTQGLG